MIDKVKALEENENLVYHIINKYTNYFDKEDLYQVGMIGLINACDNYKQDKNTKFSSYAYFYVLGEVKKYIRETNTFKVSKEIAKLNSSIKKARDALSQRLGYIPTNEEIALFLEEDVNKINEAEQISLFVASLDDEQDEKAEIYNYYGYEEQGYKEELLDLKNEINKLNQLDKTIIQKRYIDGLSQSEVSKQLGISQVKVSRYENKIKTRLKTRLM